MKVTLECPIKVNLPKNKSAVDDTFSIDISFETRVEYYKISSIKYEELTIKILGFGIKIVRHNL